MSLLGVGAVIHILGGGSKHSASEFYGRKVVSAELKDERLSLVLDDGEVIQIWDDAQSCCESRYITCDDDLSKLIGGKLSKIEVREFKEESSEYGDAHEMAFVEVATDECFITICTHNQNNGYYGGFGLTITSSKDGEL